MSDKYVHNPVAINTKYNKLKSLLKQYEMKIDIIEMRIREIAISDAWVDVRVKTEFINSCDAYIKVFTSLIERLNSTFEYMKSKTDDAKLFEENYSRVLNDGK